MKDLINDLKKKVRLLKRESVAIDPALPDKRAPVLARIMASIALDYLMSPIDLMPDVIPVSGFVGD